MCARACTCVHVQMCLLGACSRGIGDQVVDHVVLCLVLGAWPWRQTPTVAPGAGRQPWRWAPAVAPGTDPRKKQRSPLNPLAATTRMSCGLAALGLLGVTGAANGRKRCFLWRQAPTVDRGAWRRVPGAGGRHAVS